MEKPEIGFYWTKHCWCDLQKIESEEDLKDCLEDIKKGLVDGVFKDLIQAEKELDLNGGDEDSKRFYFEREKQP